MTAIERKERPILFSAPMVRALLEGRKTQTRRICKPAQEAFLSRVVDCQGGQFGDEDGDALFKSPYGQPGDRLWVKETFAAFGRWETRYSEKKGRDEWYFVDMTIDCGYAYHFDLGGISGQRAAGAAPTWHIRPSLFMPRKASRILLEVTGVRVERLQDISEADAKAEGCAPGLFPVQAAWPAGLPLTYREGYAGLWEQINGAGSWAANPWVWVVEFQRIN